MASAPGTSTEPSTKTADKKPKYTVWLSDDDSSEDSDSDDNPLNSIFKAVLKKRAMEEKQESEEKSLPSWKCSDSDLDVQESLAIFTDEEDEEEETEVKEELPWTSNFKTFTGSPLPFTGNPGTKINSTDPYTIFTNIWDKKIMALMAVETNRYVKQIAETQQREKLSESVKKGLDQDKKAIHKINNLLLNYKAMFGNIQNNNENKNKPGNSNSKNMPDKNGPNQKNSMPKPKNGQKENQGKPNTAKKPQNENNKTDVKDVLKEKKPDNTNVQEKNKSNISQQDNKENQNKSPQNSENTSKAENDGKNKANSSTTDSKEIPKTKTTKEVADKIPDKVKVMLLHGENPEMLKKIKWNDTTIDELYVLLSLYIFVSVHPSLVEEYYFKGNLLVMPSFPEIMKLERFSALNRCLHFVDNTKIVNTDKKIAKIQPIISHCNEKFSSLYQPRQFLDVDDSLLLSKDGTAGGIRSLSNNIGIRTYELSEVFTGYVLKVLQYPKAEKPLTSVEKTNIILDLVGQYANNGHRIVTDRYFCSVNLCRTLRSKGFDCIGDVAKESKELPKAIQELEQDEDDPKLYRYKGNKIRLASQHCGDVSVISWSEFDITALSTYHSCTLKPNKKGIRRPELTLECYKAKQKIMEKDDDLNKYNIAKNRKERWYVKLFKRLVNISLRNAYVIYKSNVPKQTCLTQVAFRHKLGQQLLENHGDKESVQKAWAVGMEGMSSEKSDSELDEFSDDSDGWMDVESDDSGAECCIM